MARFDADSIEKALDFIFTHGSQQDKDYYSSVIANVNRYRLQREDLLEGRADPYVNGHHPIQDLEGGVQHGRNQLAAKLRQLRKARRQ